MMTTKRAIEICHTLSDPSKMPEKAYSLPIHACKTGSKLREVKGTVCNVCYAGTGCYKFGSTQRALEKRLASLKHPEWVLAMATLIYGTGHFRWFDSGDLQGVWMLDNIVRVAELTPNTYHWMPTKERKMVHTWLKEKAKAFPDNLCVRISNSCIDPAPQTKQHDLYQTCSTFHKEAPVGFECQATKRNGTCGSCRACWDKTIAHVSYPLHL